MKSIKMKGLKKVLFFLFVSVVFVSCSEHKSALENVTFKEHLQELFPTATIDSININDHFSNAFELTIQQPLDHKNPDAGSFEHHIYVSHSDYNKPTVLITEGYNARHQTYELSKMFKANQVMVEYRFYGKSRPKVIDWQYLKNDAAADDYHAIVTKLKKIYKKKWLSTGISKGGETVMIYKSKYPNDINVAVPYVAPLINTQQDNRTTDLINSVGTKECRESIQKFQRAVLKNRTAVLAELKADSEKNKISFTKMTIDEALEHAVLEFPFSFWQWGSNCGDIPNENATAKELFKYLKQVSGFYLFSDAGIYNYLPSFYQHMTELGYYGYDLEPVKDLLQHVKTSSLVVFGPENVDLTYNANYIKKVRNFVENKGNKFLYIYGGNDPWGACAPNPKPAVDALKMVLKGGHHGTRIKDFSKEDQQKMYTKLQSWLGEDVKIYPLQ
ncbi:S28 family serine protease [Polaribacter uvawellassae]|uniref:S28 family serine protease n=1 Tax=Polaribacter uvawellassae TaxID=3133495 RepID=UPI00321925D6